MAEKMSDAEYAQTQAQLLALARVVLDMDLAGFLARIETAHAAGPVLNPTLYRRGQERMEAIRRVASAARGLQDEVRELRDLIQTKKGDEALPLLTD